MKLHKFFKLFLQNCKFCNAIKYSTYKLLIQNIVSFKSTWKCDAITLESLLRIINQYLQTQMRRKYCSDAFEPTKNQSPVIQNNKGNYISIFLSKIKETWGRVKCCHRMQQWEVCDPYLKKRTVMTGAESHCCRPSPRLENNRRTRTNRPLLYFCGEKMNG